MLSRSTTYKAGAITAVLAVALTACGGSSSGTSSSAAGSSNTTTSPTSMSMSPSASSNDTTATAAAALRAGLDQLFRQHVDLTAAVVQTAVITSPTSAQTAAALKTLDGNTVALGDAIGQIYGIAARTAFVKMWRSHINFFVEYTIGLATKDRSKVADAQSKLANYKRDFAQFLSSATNIPAAALSAELQGHIQTLEAAIQALVTQSKSAGAKLQMAAMHMDGTADALAGGIAKEKSLAGNVDSQASALRSALTGLLIQHVAQTVQVVQSVVATKSLTSPETTGAVSALDGNTQQLGTAIGAIYGSAAQTAFLKMWRAHIGFFVEFTKGVADKDAAMVADAKKKLAGYQAQFGAFLGSATGLPASAVSADLSGHIQTLESAITAILSMSTSASDKVAMAESHMAGTAAVLATAIAKQKNLS